MNFSKIPPIFTYICTFGFGIRPKARCFFGFGFGLKWKTYFRSFTDEDPVKCATVCDKSWVILLCLQVGDFRISRGPSKGQLNSEWIYEVIVSPKMQTKNYKDFCPTKQTRIIAFLFCDFFVSVGSFFGYHPCLFGRAEILVIFGLHFGRNDDLLNSFWI